MDAFVKWADDWVETNPAAKEVDPNWRRAPPHHPFPPSYPQFRHFVDCHLNKMTDDADWSENATSMWRFAIELLTADCIVGGGLQFEVVDVLGVVANVGNSDKFSYY